MLHISTFRPVALRVALGLLLALGYGRALAQAPTISSFSPTSGPANTTVTVTGTNLTNIKSVVLRGIPCNITPISATSASFKVPAQASTGRFRLTTTGGNAFSSSVFTVTRASSSLTYVLRSSNFNSIDVGDFSTPAFTDLDHDGLIDMLVGREIDGLVAHYEQSAANSTSFTLRSTNLSGLTGHYNSLVSVTDIDGDGLLELVVGTGAGNFKHYEQTAMNGTSFTQLSNDFNNVFSAGGLTFQIPHFTDIDGDGLLDLLVGDEFLSRYEQTAANGGTFTQLNNQNFGPTADASNGGAAACVTDLDGDGLLDMLVGRTNGQLFHHEQASANSTSFPSVATAFNGLNLSGYTAPAITDFDGDGLLDLLVGGSDGVLRHYEQVGTPTITSFTPTSGVIGTSVTITGTNLDGATAARVNGTNGTIVGTPTSTSLTFTVGAGSTTGVVTVITPGGTATGSTFTVTAPAPTITSFNPTSGVIGTSVTVTGTNLNGATAARVNGTAGTIVGTPTSTSLTFTVGAGSTTGAVTVITPGGTATGSTFTVTTPPTITSFNPTSGPVGTSITITGTNLTGAILARVNFAVGTITANTATSLTFTVGAGSTTGAVSVTTTGGTATSSTFTVIPAPTITSFTPTSGPVGTSIVITGTNLSSATFARVNGTAGTITANTATSLTFTVAAGSTTGAVSVTTAGGTATGSTFTVIQPPTITNFTPTSGPVGTSIVITGTNLSSATAARVNGTAGTITANMATSLTFTVGAGSATGAVSVVTPGGTATGSTFTVTVPPTITSFTPTSGPAGTSVTLTGTNLGGVTGVRFGTGGLTTNFVSQSATSLTVLVPVVSSTGVITLTSNTGATASTATNFTYTPRPAGLTATLSPAGPLDVCAARTLTASASSPAFGTGTGFNGAVQSVTAQADGKVLVGGNFLGYNGTTALNGLVRLNADGTRDATFVTGTGFNGNVFSVAVQADGKVLMGGDFTSYNGTTGLNRLVRLNTDGTRDVSFATGTGFDNQVRSLSVQADGQVLVGGGFTSYNGTTGVNRLVRLNADGSRDASFATGTGFDGVIRSVAVQADGRLLAGGDFASYNGTTGVNRLVRLNADGSRDASFATGTGFPSIGEIVQSVAVQADGQLLAGGNFTSYNGTTGQNRLVRLNADGSLNAAPTAVTGATFTFAPGGTTTNPLVTSTAGTYSVVASLNGETSAASNAVVLTACLPTITSFTPTSGPVGTSIVVSGTNLSGATFARVNGTAGTITANTATSLTFTVAAGSATGAVSVTTAGGTATGSTFTVIPPPTITSFTPASGLPGSVVTITGTNFSGATGVRFNGVLTNGLTVTSPTSLTAYVPVGATTGTLRVTTPSGTATSATAFTVTAIAPDVAVAVTPAGPLSACGGPTLTAAATIRPFVPPGTGLNSTVYAVAQQPDGKLLVGGDFTSYNGVSANCVIRLNADGSPDATFATTGTGLNNEVYAMALQPDGKVLLGGRFISYNGTAASRVIRLNADGSRDASFSPTGTGLSGDVYAMALQPDGKVLLGGPFTSYDGVLANRAIRLNADGSRDASFSPTGTGLSNTVRTMALQPDGKVLLGGDLLTYNGVANSHLIRLNADGSRDASFSVGTGFNNDVNAVAVQPDGKVLLGGQFTSYNGAAAQRVIRLNADGSPDATFATIGTGLNNTVWSVALQPDGNVLFGGDFTFYNGAAANHIIRLNADGSPDGTFAPTGIGLDGCVNAVVVQTNGQLLLGGDFTFYNGAVANYLIRLNANGTANNTPTPVPGGATYTWTPGGSTGPTVVPVLSGGSYQATATVEGYPFLSNTVSVTPCLPTITNISPSSGSVGTSVTITGTNLSAATLARVNGTAGTITANTATSLTFTVAAGSTTGAVSVTTPGGTATGSTFTVIPAPTITSLSAALGPEGTTITLTGTNFTGATAVAFNGAAAASFTLVSATQLTATVAVGATTGTVSVTTPGGTGTSVASFEVLPIFTGTFNNCLNTTSIISTGSGQWHYLRAANGDLVAALNDQGTALGTVSVDFYLHQGAVRADGNGREYFDRNWKLTAANPFVGQNVRVRFYARNPEFTAYTAANDGDGSDVTTVSQLRITQYSGPNEDCLLTNNGSGPGRETRLLTPANNEALPGANWFALETVVADHFSEFFLNGGNAPLPVELVRFEAQRTAPKQVTLTWQTASEKNNRGYYIERGANGREFAAISGLIAGAGTTQTPQAYAYADETAPASAQLYYRLRQLDTDGTATYSSIVTVQPAPLETRNPILAIWPNPVLAGEPLRLSGAAAAASVELYDVTGRAVALTTAAADGTATVPTAHLPMGVYVLRSGKQTVRVVLK